MVSLWISAFLLFGRMDSGPEELPARRVSRLGELADILRPTASSAGLGSAGIVVKTYRVAAEFDSGPFSLAQAAVAIVHRGTLGLRLTFTDLDRTLGIGGLAVIPAATPLSLQFANADITVCYLTPDRVPHVPPALHANLEIVTRLDPEDVQLAFLMSTVRDEVQAGNPLGSPYLESLGLSLTVRLFGCYARKMPAAVPHRGGLTDLKVRQAKH